MWSLHTIQTLLCSQKLLIFLSFCCIVLHRVFMVLQKPHFIFMPPEGWWSRGKEELQLDFFWMVSLKCLDHGLCFLKALVYFVYKACTNAMHSYWWHVFSCEPLPTTLLISHPWLLALGPSFHRKHGKNKPHLAVDPSYNTEGGPHVVLCYIQDICS